VKSYNGPGDIECGCFGELVMGRASDNVANVERGLSMGGETEWVEAGELCRLFIPDDGDVISFARGGRGMKNGGGC